MVLTDCSGFLFAFEQSMLAALRYLPPCALVTLLYNIFDSELLLTSAGR